MNAVYYEVFFLVAFLGLLTWVVIDTGRRG